MTAVPVPDYGDGWPAEKVFSSAPHGCNLDEIVFLPGALPVKPKSVTIATKLTRHLSINLPVIAGPTNSVTEAEMAIQLALMGGVGIIHRKQSIADQAAQVRRVKQYETGFILNPQMLGMHNTVAEADRIRAEHGCSGIPITATGRMGGKLVGIVTSRDIDAAPDRNAPLKTIMTHEVVYATEPVILREALQKMQKEKVAKLPVLNEDRELVALICRGDLKRHREHPDATLDANKQLVVGAAVSARGENAWDRARALVDAGVDFLLLDTDEGIGPDTVEYAKRLKETFDGTDVIAGRVSCCQQAKELANAGVDALRVGAAGTGFGPGGAGAEATSIFEVARFARISYGIPVLFDGKVRNASHMLKGICLGASAVFLDTMLDGTEEAPGEHYYREGVRVKLGCSPALLKGNSIMSTHIPGAVVDKGPAKTLINHVLEAVQSGLKDLGIKQIGDIGQALAAGLLRLERQMPPRKELMDQPQLQRSVVSSLHCQW